MPAALAPSRVHDRAGRGTGLLLEPLPGLAGVLPLGAAERLRDLPGLALLESARPGRRARWSYLAADPLAVREAATDGQDPFAGARTLLASMEGSSTADGLAGAARPPFSGGLIGFLGYDLGRRLERLPTLAPADQLLLELRLGLYDQVVAWDHASGVAWLASRAVGDDIGRMLDRRDAFAARLLDPTSGPTDRYAGPSPSSRPEEPPRRFRSNLDRAAFMTRVGRVREEIERGELYQANVARRLEAPFEGDPWPLYRRLRGGDPVGHAAYLDLGPDPQRGRPRALVSASPESFLGLSVGGEVATDPIKGTRPRGDTRQQDRALACELLASAKDRAENTMIVDVLRNDLGRVCRPGSIRVPRLCRLERTGSVQHLVSTVTGQLAVGRDAFHLLGATFPGGSITGAPKVRAMELIETLEPVRRGPYTGVALWLGADGGLGSSILIRTFVADGRLLTLHVGGGITWRSDPVGEWEETRTKAHGPLAALGSSEAEG